MESTLHQINKHYSDLGPGEKKIANFILENTQELFDLSISELAVQCNCGEATIVRFSQRFGFQGYQGLKIGILKEFRETSTINRELLPEDTCYTIFRKRIADIVFTLESTEAILNEDNLEAAANLIMQANRIVIFGLGNSASIATDAAHKLLRLGFNAQACCDNHMQAIIASHLDRKSVAIGISHSGQSKDIIEALQLSKIGSAKTICITNYQSSPLVKASDIALFTKSEETKHSILALSSRIAQLAIIDAIYSYIVIHSDKASLQAIYNTEYSLNRKKCEPAELQKGAL